MKNAPGQPDATPERSLAEVARELVARTVSRRQVLRWMGGSLAGAVLARFPGLASAATTSDEKGPAGAIPHGEPLRGIALTSKNRSLEGRFGLMFKELEPFEPPDDLLIGLATSMEEPQDASLRSPDNPDIPAGYVLLGQFIDHDLTFDPTPVPAQLQDPDALTNFSSAGFDLDSVYGRGPGKNPEFYELKDPAKLRLSPERPYDLPRRRDGTAIIGDPRDDTNLITSQLHLAFRKFHNALVHHVRSQGLRGVGPVFKEARRLCQYHYQWMVVHDFLPHMVGQDLIDAILREPAEGPAEVRLKFYHPENTDKPMMPIEFAVAAYRFGHSMLLPRYTINEEEGDAALFGAEPTEFNLNGKRQIPPRLKIAWRHFFGDIPDETRPPTNFSRPIDVDLSAPLFTLPTSIVPPPDTRVSLAERNLLRGKRLGLPSGQQVATAMRLPTDLILTGPDLFPEQSAVRDFLVEKIGAENVNMLSANTPLWYYILREAQVQKSGERLGEVGGRIVAEVFLGLLKFDGSSYLSEDPIFRPKPPIAREDGVFTMGDLLKFAGVA
jgi:Animal haem peroxidase